MDIFVLIIVIGFTNTSGGVSISQEFFGAQTCEVARNDIIRQIESNKTAFGSPNSFIITRVSGCYKK